MASSSSSNKSTPTNKLLNSYFFYGTHPLKVPTTLVHANSTTGLSSSTADQNTHHLSLNLTNSTHNNIRHGFSSTTDLTITKSLHNLTQSRPNNDENNEVKKNKKKRLFLMITYICHCPYNIIISININICCCFRFICVG
jgi:hypothetical protein